MEMDSLLDPVIDSSHRSFFAAVEHRALEVLRPRSPGEATSIHHDWVDRLRESGLLTLGRLVEGGLVQLDRSLLTALVDRWRPETHTPAPRVRDPVGQPGRRRSSVSCCGPVQARRLVFSFPTRQQPAGTIETQRRRVPTSHPLPPGVTERGLLRQHNRQELNQFNGLMCVV
ncbi:hypothetical protein PVAP13_5KG527921 [Panicum virgatum]|uniref:Uncharacterized protein n=1 Tax=Panicum virgatum TaxID=38727 RepID=A0A8T0SM55_PANVG|nr:hypothetical protein PVAP13_5KG527921 [Panicum virgatum]